MSESLTHHNYVVKIYEKVKDMIPQSDLCFLSADLFECKKPNLVYGNFIPDVMFCHNKLLIIGEAKTLDDYKKEHSYQQYETYMKECSQFPGESYFIICIPWSLFISAQKHFKLLKNKYNVATKVIVLADNGWEVTL